MNRVYLSAEQRRTLEVLVAQSRVDGGGMDSTWDESWHGQPPGDLGSIPSASTDEEIVAALDGRGECHGCGRLMALYPCPYADELYDDASRVCCEDCAPEHALEI